MEQDNRVLARGGGGELTPNEMEAMNGALQQATICTIVTPPGHLTVTAPHSR